MQATIGFRAKSGWAAAVLLAGPAATPRVIQHRVVTLSDPGVPASRQPYHAGTGVARTDDQSLRRLTAEVRRYGARSVAGWVAECRAAGYLLAGAGVVGGSELDPERIANPHIRAHAAEGRLFRGVVEDAARGCGLTCTTFVERELLAYAAAVLSRSEASLGRALAELGRGLPPPWRREQKAAAAAAWVVLASAGEPGVTAAALQLPRPRFGE
jgi:hypothetical protein